MRGMLAAAALAACAAGAHAAPSHAKLDGFAGVPFGATIGAAQTALGVKAKPDFDPPDKTAELKFDGDVFGEPATLNFKFGAQTAAGEGAMDSVYAMKPLGAARAGAAACYARGKQALALARAQYGAPTMQFDIGPAANDPLGPGFNAAFHFDDGALIRISEAACVLLVDAYSPQAARGAP